MTHETTPASDCLDEWEKLAKTYIQSITAKSTSDNRLHAYLDERNAALALADAAREAIPALIGMVRWRDATLEKCHRRNRKLVADELAAEIRATAAEAELAQLKARYAPGHTDMMVSPEALDEWIEKNPPPDDTEIMVQRGADALPYLWTDHDRQQYARRVIYAAMEVRPPPGRLYVHRDLGPGFTHSDSPDCPCVPHVVDPDDQQTSDQLIAAIEKKERGDA